MKIKSASGIGPLNAALFAGAAAALSLHVAAPAPAANLEVCPSGCAYATIRGAIDAAAPGDFLTVGPGAYLERIRIDKVIDVVSTGGPTVTTINGGGGGTTVTFGAPGAPSLFGFTVTGGDACVAYGGGILASNGARPVINYCVVAGNSAQYGAGIACLATSSVSIANSRVTGNQTAFRPARQDRRRPLTHT